MQQAKIQQKQGQLPTIQTKTTGSNTSLKIGAPNDHYEREADAMANRIMRMPQAFSRQPLSNGANSIQRTCSACAHEEEQIRRQPIRMKSEGGTPTATPALQSQLNSSKGSGSPLPSATNSQMSHAFGTDFSHVRIHADSRARTMNAGLQARAFTHGSDIYFNRGEYSPNTNKGKHLLGHELTHVVQQGASISRKAQPYIARAPLDLSKLDMELFWGNKITQMEGEVGYGSAKGRKKDPAAEDQSLPITAKIFPRNTDHVSKPTNTPQQATPTVATPTTPTSLEGAQQRNVVGNPDRSTWRLDPSGLLEPAKRALIISGIHGDERGALDLVKQLQKELADGKHPLARDFDVLVIPNMNPWGIKKKSRFNRRRIDLNRNFPGIKGFPPSTNKLPVQPEVKAILNVIKIFNPERILSLHAIGDAHKGGVYADPVEGDPVDGPARELACRMAVLSLGESTKGKWSAEINVRGNKVAKGVCNSRYPGSPPKITSDHTSLGAMGSADPALGGLGKIVITHEVAGKSHLKSSGKGRSVETLMPGIREFLLDNEDQSSAADGLLEQTVNEAFLQGDKKGKKLALTIQGIVAARFKDLNKYYKQVWLPQQGSAKKAFPSSLSAVSHYRGFAKQASIVKGQLKRLKINSKSSAAEVKAALEEILTTRSMPGFSRHHWGTEMDIVSATRTQWEPGKKYANVIPFLQEEARKFGFYHPYSTEVPALGIKGFTSTSLPHYKTEPWHLSYVPLSSVIQKEWANVFQGTRLETLIEETAKAIASSKKNQQHLDDIKKALQDIGIEHFQTNIAPPS